MWKALPCALAVLFTAGAARAEPPVWIVRDKDSELVLFGSVHVLPKGLKWRPAALDRALARADDLWFELPVDAASELETARLADQRGALPPGQSLSKMLPLRDAQRLERVARTYGVAPAQLDRLQPWLAEIALAWAVYRTAGADAENGVEKTLAAAAPARTQRRALETPREQISILAGAPQAEQIASLRQTLVEMEETPDAFRDLVRAWMAGDLAGLEREALQPLRKAAPTLFRRIVTDRNANWAAILDQRLKGKGRTVVVVGAGHLIGEGSVPRRLAALGYRVEGP